MDDSHPKTYKFAPKTVALIGKYQSREISESLCLLARELQRRGLVVIV